MWINNEEQVIDLAKALGEMARVADMVCVVRCRDCKHYDPSDGYCEFIGDYDFDENFYCGNGKRKDGDSE